MASVSDIPALVRSLRSSWRVEQLQAAEALVRVLAGDAVAVQALLAARGGAAPARMVVSSHSKAAQRAAARALNAADDTSARAMRGVAEQLIEQAGEELPPASLPALLALLQNSDSDVQKAAAFIINAVATTPHLRSALVEAGGLTALLGCLRQHAGPSSQQ